MFNFFKKKKKKEYLITKVELAFFKSLITVLPSKYRYLLPQINDGFLLAFKENVLGFKDSYTFLLNAKLEPIYINKKLPHFFILQNIKVWNKVKNDYISVNLNILSGYLGGFNVESTEFSNFDFTKFDISDINEKHFENKELDDLLVQSNFNSTNKVLFEQKINYTYSIKIPEGIFFYIDHISNGDVLAIDLLGNCYLLIHDPYKVIKIFNTEEFFFKLETDSLLKDATEKYEYYARSK
ncbi:hypothetical protein [Flavobacterium pectinovorum]|uniref:Uncharacterized protein n=1 Tax=Flavobacterium pectinovorum TaxID=29533 RepID=A0A502ET67_9FLAO|nr:hypothetical protein [Flavobacterium pectinovorum]TPG40252.1 hypothetical protein EAH81_13245 [Flavobacterium pectinovorum]